MSTESLWSKKETVNQAKKKGALPCGRPAPEWLETQFTDKEHRLELLKKKLDDYVASNKLNQSDSRLQILKVVAEYESHFTAHELIERIAKISPVTGTATVYRSIQFFVQAGILRETLATESGERIYETELNHHHDHIVCIDCGAILEFHEQAIESLQKKVLTKMDFRESHHRHVVYAHCEYKK
jgi:Fur family transcriptional regulator, ferric uptake regulator